MQHTDAKKNMQSKHQGTKAISKEEARLRLASLCAMGEHCEGECRKKMDNWGISSTDQEEIINFLLDERYVDDLRYARSYAKDKRLYSGWGARKISQGLYSKGVARNITCQALEEVSDEEYVKVLKNILASKRRSVSGDNEYEINGKLIRFALGRGFSYAQIRCCINSADDYEIEEGDDE